MLIKSQRVTGVTRTTNMMMLFFYQFKVDWSQYIAVNSATAHPHYDREGATYNMGNSYGKSGNLPAMLPCFPPTLYIICVYTVITSQ